MAAYESYRNAQERLLALGKAGRGDSPTADKIRGELDELWAILTNEERDMVREDLEGDVDVVG